MTVILGKNAPKKFRNSEDTQEQENKQSPYETDLQEAGSWIGKPLKQLDWPQGLKR